MNGWIVDYGCQILIFAIFAVSLNLLVGYTGQVSVAHAAFGGIGGYTAALLAMHAGAGFFVTLLAAMVVAGAAGLLVGTPALGLTGEYLILLTLAASATLTAVINSVRVLGGEIGLNGIPLPELFGTMLIRPADWLPWLVLLFALVCLVSWLIVRAPVGLLLRGIRENDVAARSLGKSVFAWKLSAFAFTSAVAGLAGALLVYYGTVAAPQTFNLDQSMFIFAMIIVGGMGNLVGSVVGATLLVLLQPLLERVLSLPPETAALVRLVVFGLALILVIRLRPQGVVPERTRRRAVPIGELSSSENGVSLERLYAAADVHKAAEGLPREVLVVENLVKRFGGITAADHLSLSLERHKITALVGPNGAGKTTVFSLATGMIRPDSGRVLLDGVDVTGRSMNRIARAGMVRSFQDVKAFRELTVLENVLYAFPDQPGESLGRALFRPRSARLADVALQERAMEWLRFVGMSQHADAKTGSISFGDQRLVTLARTIASGADVLLLDEPTSGMDTQWVDRMIELIKLLPQLGKTVCIVEHNLQVVERLSDHVYFMELGRVTAQGRMSDLVTDQRLTEAYFGTAH